MSMRMFDVEGFILVGGQSSRMGSDKSQLVFGQQTGVERIARALRPLSTRVRLVGSHVQAEASGLANVPDTHERWGALGGIGAALGACQSEWAVVVACDLPLVSGDLFHRLCHLTQQTHPQTVDAIVPIQADGRPQPLCAVYRCVTCSGAAKKLIAEGEHKARALLATVRTRWVEFRELVDLPGSEHFFLNVNTSDDYERAKQALDRLQRKTT
jgi:molybdopterin-guanine dinucleotide biosynthesis protein A